MLKRFLVSTLFACTLSIALLSCSSAERPAPQPPALAGGAGVEQPTASAPRVQPTVALMPPFHTPQSTTSAGTTRFKIFLVAIDDNGRSGKKIGCGDSVVAVERDITPTRTPLAAALTELFSIRHHTSGKTGLYNSLYESTLRVEGANISGGKATINLSGTLLLGGVCDNPRIKAQIEETALQFSTVTQVQVFINNIPIDQVLSLK